jgi:hypothetical protein
MTQQINLFNPAFIPKRELLTGQNLALAALALVLLIAPLSYWSRTKAQKAAAELVAVKARQQQSQEALDALVKAAQARKPSAALLAEIDQTRQLIAMRDEVLAAVGVRADLPEASFAAYLAGLARQTRDGLWLSGFSVASGGAQLSLSGKAIDKALLPQYIQRLNSEPAFAGKTFGGLRIEYRDLAAVKGVAAAVPPAPTSGGSPVGPERFIEFRLLAEPAPGAVTKS